MKKTTHDLNEAAFYSLFKAPLLSINGKYPNNSFTFMVYPQIAWYEKSGGFVPYNKYCKERQKLKIQCRKLAGLPESFTGKKEYGFKIMDLIIDKLPY